MLGKSKLRVGPRVFFLLEEELIKSNNKIERKIIYLSYIKLNIKNLSFKKLNICKHIYHMQS